MGASVAEKIDNFIEFPELSQQSSSEMKLSRAKNYDYERHEGRNGTVDPIRNKEDIKRIADYFWGKGEYRNWCLFIVGINTAYRASDLLRLKVSDIADCELNGQLHIKKKASLRIKEKKTQKYRSVEISPKVIRYIEIYLQNNPLHYEDWLFPSDKSSGKNSFRTNGGVSVGEKSGKFYLHEAQPKKAGDPLDVDSFGKIMRRAQKDLGLTYRLGTHSCRKTFGYWFMQENKGDAYALAWLQKALNHSSQAITLKYIGLAAEDDKRFYESVDYGMLI